MASLSLYNLTIQSNSLSGDVGSCGRTNSQLYIQSTEPICAYLLDREGSIVYMSSTGFPVSSNNCQNVQWSPNWVGNGHVHNPFDLVGIIQLTVGPQHLHHHVQGSGPWKRDVLQQRQVFLLSKLVTDGFPFSEIKNDKFGSD